MSALTLGGMELARAGARVDSGGFDDDTTVLDESLDVSTRVGVSNFCLLGRIKPNFALSDACDARGEAFL